MKPQMDWAMCELWTDMHSTGVRPLTFMLSFKQELGLFMQEPDLSAVLGATDGFEKVADSVKRVIESSRIGSSLLRFAWSQVARAHFRTEISRKLRDLEHMDFQAAAIADFKNYMSQLAAALAANSGTRSRLSSGTGPASTS